jgi:CubicO group peptidase (beta-lactamase class C family)
MAVTIAAIILALSINASTAARIDAVFSAYDHRGSPGFALGIIKDEALLYVRGYGDANIENRVPIDERTDFHLASLSKQFTASAIALLVLQRRLSLDDPVAKYVPRASVFGPALRVKDLVYMTSGLPDYSALRRANGLPWYSSYYFTRDEALAAVFASRKLLFAPGTRYDYTNTNYMLLTKIVERVTGIPFATYMHETIFTPLGMTGTSVNDDPTQIIPHRAYGYAPRVSKVIAQLKSVGITARAGSGWIYLARTSPHFGGSGVFSNIDDLAKWDTDWYSQQLAPGFTALMTTRERFAFGAMDGMGLGFRAVYGKLAIDYSGADIDASTFMERIPSERFTIICLSNDPLGDAEEKADAVLAILREHII